MNDADPVLGGDTNPSTQPWDGLCRRAAMLGAATAIVLGFVTGCGTASHEAGPAVQATAAAQLTNTPAAAVVRAYITALNAHDVAAASSMLTPEHLHTVQSEVDSWFTNVKTIAALGVGAAVSEKTEGSGDLAAGYKLAVHVPVTFTLQQKHVESMPNGVTDWGYLLVRNADQEPWRIADEGVS